RAPLPALFGRAHQLPAQRTTPVERSLDHLSGPVVDHRPANSGTGSQSSGGGQVDPSSTPHLHQNGQSGSALPAPVGGTPLPALTQLQGQAPTTQTRLLQKKFLYGFDIDGRDPSSADHTPRFVLRPSATQLRN